MGRLQCPVQKSAVPLEKLNGVTNISVLLLRFTDTPLCKSLERGLGSRGLHISGDLWHQWNRSRKKMWSWDGRIREGMKWCRTNTEWRWCRETGHTRHKGLEIWHKETWWVLQWKRRQGICREPYPFSKALLHETAVEREKEREKERDKKCFLFQLRFLNPPLNSSPNPKHLFLESIFLLLLNLFPPSPLLFQDNHLYSFKEKQSCYFHFLYKFMLLLLHFCSVPSPLSCPLGTGWRHSAVL